MAPEQPEAHAGLGLVSLAEGKLKTALQHYETAARLDPKRLEPRMKIGEIHLRTGAHAQAAEAYQKAVLIKPDHAPAHHNLGMALAHLDRGGEALAGVSKGGSVQRGAGGDAVFDWRAASSGGARFVG